MIDNGLEQLRHYGWIAIVVSYFFVWFLAWNDEIKFSWYAAKKLLNVTFSLWLASVFWSSDQKMVAALVLLHAVAIFVYFLINLLDDRSAVAADQIVVFRGGEILLEKGSRFNPEYSHARLPTECELEMEVSNSNGRIVMATVKIQLRTSPDHKIFRSLYEVLSEQGFEKFATRVIRSELNEALVENHCGARSREELESDVSQSVAREFSSLGVVLLTFGLSLPIQVAHLKKAAAI